MMENQKAGITTEVERDYLWLNLRELPYFRAVLRAVEARSYQQFDLPGPILDLGCGDGQFVTTAFTEPLDVGLDPWTGPVHLAGKAGGHRLVIQGSGDLMPFPSAHFGSAISNSVLEHIPELDSVLAEMARVLKPGAMFVFCVPNHNFLANLSISNFLDRIGLRFLGEAYRRFFNWISRHYHCDSPEVWQERLTKAGFEIERYWHYFSPRALRILELGHYWGVPTVLNHFVFKRWILVPQRWNFVLTNAIVKAAYEEEVEQPQGSYSFYVARRKIR
jgi:SAM-dependent methyltransferase